MQLPEIPDPVIFVVGPTGVGKSAFAVEVAEQINGEIISADSRQLYKQMDIGTAKPSRQERERVLHYLVDILDPDEPWSITDFLHRSKNLIGVLHLQKKYPMAVGGTGQYVHALMYGWNPPTAQPDIALRTVLESWGNRIGREELHKLLLIVDPAAAKVIDPSNMRRTVRALEVIFVTGNRFSNQRSTRTVDYSTITIGLNLPRTQLYERIDSRIDAMIINGLVYEVERLRNAGYSWTLPSMSSIGYREINQYLNGEVTLEEAIRLIKRHTREYVRRQANWFKKDAPDIYWFNSDGEATNYALEVLSDRSKWTIKVKRTA